MSEQNYKDFFEEAMNQIHQEYAAAGTENDFKLFFNFEYVEDTISDITVSVASEFMWTRMVKKGNVEKLQQKINELTGQNISIRHIVNSKPAEPPAFVPQETPKTEIPQPEKFGNETAQTFSKQKTQENYASKKNAGKHPQLNEEFTFSTFIPGDNSQYAYSVCIAAAKTPGSRTTNPILLYGSSGLGKTHLMVSVGNYIYENSPNLKIGYLTTESFMNEFTSAIREKSIDKFTKKYRKLDVLLLDDIQFLEGKEGLQNELFYTFEDIYNRKGQLVFTSDRPITEIKGIEDRLKTRFTAGLSIDMKAPDYETRLAIIDKKLELQGKSISQEIKEFIAKNIQSNVRELEGALLKSLNYAELMNRPLTLDLVKELLSDSLTSQASNVVTVESIQKTISEFYNISVADLKSSKRNKSIAGPRHIAVWLCKKLTEYSLSDIGEEFGGRDHTTIMSSIRKIDDQLKTDSTMNDTVKLLEKQIKGS